MIIKLRAKVQLMSEEDMEIQDQIELKNYKSQKWLWKWIAFEADEIYQIIQYTSDKTLLIMKGDERILVKETFEEVFKLWTENVTQDLTLNLEDEDENYEINGEEE